MIEAVKARGSRETVGERLKRLRLNAGLSQRELSSPGVSYAYISRIEAGTRQPSMKALRRLAPKLGVSVVHLETGSDLTLTEQRELRLLDLELALRLGGSEIDVEAELATLASEAVKSGDRHLGSRAQIDLALIAEARGDHAAAIEHFDAACQSERPSPIERVGVFVTVGRAYAARGESDREIDLYRSCIEEVEGLGVDDNPALNRYRIRLSYALSDIGQFAEARRVLEGILEGGSRSDGYMRVRLYWSLARLSEMEGDSSSALRYAKRAITLLEATEDEVQLGRAHILAAWIMNSDRDPQAACAQLDRAELLLRDGCDADDLALLKIERARACALLGEGDDAVLLAREAIEMIGERNDAALGTAFWALASGLAIQGDDEAADVSFERGVDLLEATRRWREAELACQAWAEAVRTSGDEQRARSILARAQRLSANLPTAAQVDQHGSLSLIAVTQDREA